MADQDRPDRTGGTGVIARVRTEETVTETWVERRAVSKGWGWLPAVVGLPVVFALGIGPVRGSIEDKLEDKANAAVADAGFEGVEVWARGRDAHLRGDVPTDEVGIARLHEIVRSRIGVRHVFDPDVSGPGAKPAADAVGFEVAIVDGKIVLTGTVPNQATKDALVAAAVNAVGAANVEDRLVIGGAAAAGLDTGIAGLTAAIDAIAHTGLQTGTVSFEGGAIVLEGEVPTESARTAVGRAAAALVGGDLAKVTNRLRVIAVAATAVPTTAVPTTAVPTTAVPTTAVPTTTVVPQPAPQTTAPPAAAPQRFVVYFDTDVDVPNATSVAVLEQAVAAAGAAAAGTKLVVTGFADVRNGPDYNLDLSRRRAENVLASMLGANRGLIGSADAKGIDTAVTGDLQQARRAEIVIG